MAGPEFDDGKDDGAFRTIGEVSKALSIKTHVLRYWEEQFPMLEPLKRSGGRRYYRPEDIALIQRIDDLVNEQGYTLKGAKQALKDNSDKGEKAEADISIEQVSAGQVSIEQERASLVAQAEEISVRETQPVDNDSDAMSRAEIVERLKDIRGNLAVALDR